MIVLYEENEINFTSLGLGVLSDPISCIVTEGLNDNFELEMVYPVIGKDYSKLKIGRLISSKTNPYDEDAQPFRITSITKPINGKVTVNAVHISYDTNGVIIGPIKGNNLRDTVDKIQNGFIIPHNFKIYTDISVPKTFTTNNYYNLRALLMGDDSSLINVYNLEASFDKFKIFLNKLRGQYRGTQIRYAKNMKDLTHVISYEKLYNGVYPFYHQEVTETTTNTTQDGFQQVYIVGNKPFQDGWLSYTDGGEPYHPVNEAPVQIGTEGDYYGKVYCWNTDLQRFQEKLYNETVTIIEGVMQPEWIFIDWSALPTLTCRAKKEGYFKLMIETEWTFHKVDEIVFQGSFKDVAESLIMYYSEVIPESTDSEITTTESITHVELKDKIIWIDTEAAKSMLYNRILSLDLTSEFEDVPTEDDLELKAKKYIEKNKIGQYKYETRVSFVDLSRTTEGVSYEGFDKVLLGDIIKVIYEDMNVDVELRVISTKYDALKDAYDSVDLGEKPDKISSSSVQNGDGISALTNDVGYADITTVNKLIAKTITADYIKAVNATLTKAQIEELETARIRCSGIIEASQFELDSLVAKLLVADNAVIKETLEAGTVKINGDITVSKGSINIRDDEKGTVFTVDREGNLKANSVEITGGSLNINDGIFKVTPDGTLYATGAVIRGEMHAFSGEIAQFTISEDSIYNGIAAFDEESSSNGVYIGTDGIRLGNKFTVDDDGNISIRAGSIQIQNGTGTDTSFKVTPNGELTATGAHISGSLDIKGGSITIEKTEGDKTFYVNNQGDLQAKSVVITGEINAESGIIGTESYHFNIGGDDTNQKAYIYSRMRALTDVSNDGVYIGTDGIALGKGTFKVLNTGATSVSSLDVTGIESSWHSLQLRAVKDQDNTTRAYMAYGKDSIDSINSGIYVGTDGLALGSKFKVLPDGSLTASSVSITGGAMGWSSTGKSFNVDPDGTITATGAVITGEIKAESGIIGTEDYHFNIGGDDLNERAYIYSGMTSFSDKTHDGIYIGTEGIALGKGAFKVTKDGAITISGYATETYADGKASDAQQAAETYADGAADDAEQAAKDWVGEQGYQNATQVTTITEDTIKTTTVIAQYLQVKKLKVEDDNGNVLLDAGSTYSNKVTIGGFSIVGTTMNSNSMTIDPDGNIFGAGLILSNNIQANDLSLKGSIISKDITLSGVKLSAGVGSNTKTITFSAHVSVNKFISSRLDIIVTASETVPENTTINVALKIFTNFGTYNDTVSVTINAGAIQNDPAGHWDCPSSGDSIIMFVERGLNPQSKTYSGTAYLKCSNYSLVGMDSTSDQAFKIGYAFVHVDGTKQGEGYKKYIYTGLSTIVAATATIYIDTTDDSAFYNDYENLNVRWDGGTIKVISKFQRYVTVMYIGY